MKEQAKKIIAKIVCVIPFSVSFLTWLLLPLAIFKACVALKSWPDLFLFKKTIDCKDNKAIFLIKYFSRSIVENVFCHWLSKHSDCFMTRISIEGAEHVRKINNDNRGVLVVSSHSGPVFLQSFLFKQYFKIKLSSYAQAAGAKRIKKGIASSGLVSIVQEMPLYSVGEEKSLLKGLLQGEWVNILNDVDLSSMRRPNCRLLGHSAALSEFPFRVALKYQIPLLFVSIHYSQLKKNFVVSIHPFDDFISPHDGLSLYVQYLEEQISNDFYSNRETKGLYCKGQ